MLLNQSVSFNAQDPIISEISKHVQINHSQIYKGRNDRNNYQISDELFVKWEKGCIKAIHNTSTGDGFLFEQVDGIQKVTRTHLSTMAPRGFYVDISQRMNLYLGHVLHYKVTEFYLKTSLRLTHFLNSLYYSIINSFNYKYNLSKH